MAQSHRAQEILIPALLEDAGRLFRDTGEKTNLWEHAEVNVGLSFSTGCLRPAQICGHRYAEQTQSLSSRHQRQMLWVWALSRAVCRISAVCQGHQPWTAILTFTGRQFLANVWKGLHCSCAGVCVPVLRLEGNCAPQHAPLPCHGYTMARHLDSQRIKELRLLERKEMACGWALYQRAVRT